MPQSQFSHLRRGFLVAAALCALYLFIDAGKDAAGVVLAWRAAWIAALLAAAAVQSARRPVLARLVAHGAALVSGVATVAIVRAVGGSAGPAFSFLMALPLVVLALAPELPSAAALTGAITGGGGIYVLAGEGRPAAFVGEWGLLSLVVTALAVTGALGFRRVWLAELSAERDRAEALERLAESEQRRGRAERLAAVGRLAAGVAHEVKNPLSFVKANVDWIAAQLADGRLGAEGTQVLGDTRLGIDRIDRIVTDLAGLSREGPDETESCDAEASLAEALRLASTRFGGVNVRRTVEPGLPLARGSHRLLSQALVNLLVNAADAAQEAAAPERRWVEASAFLDGDALVLAVEDGGHGLLPGTEELVFEPFFTTKGPKGMGLGLALAREQVARCRGTLEAANVPGGGARFMIRLRQADSIARG